MPDPSSSPAAAAARPTRLAILTSGGDSAGMNAAVRAAVRTALAAGLEAFGVYEGLQGLIDGGDRIRSLSSGDVGGILHRGGTVLGTARSPAFRTRDGLRRAAANLVERGVDALVVIGGDGSLSGAAELRAEWPGLLDELVAAGDLTTARADVHRHLGLVGLVGSIDNDMFGTDMTIGTDTALHRIVEAVDAIQSTASSHQRTFVIEVMGRRCGYLALMGGVATGANFAFIPEHPPGDHWEDAMSSVLRAGREIGRRASVVLVAEGARDRHGSPISAGDVKSVLEERLGEDARVTVLGHVQRGGAPSAFDRFLGTLMGYAGVRQLLESPGDEPQLIGIRGHHLSRSPLMECVAATRSIGDVISDGRFDTAMEMRGGSFRDSYDLLRTMVQARPRRAEPGQRTLRLAVLHAGGAAPGMNTAARIAVRVALDRGHTMLGVRDGFRGLVGGEIEELDWMSVSGWVSRPGAELGTDRFVPPPEDMPRLAAELARHRIDGLVMIGGWAGYVAAHALNTHRVDHAEPGIPIVCVPASINNDLPASDLAIGSDSALNGIVTDVDKIKDSAVASHRCFIVEVMGRDCGYLAMMAGLATGAEQVYLPEEGISLAGLQEDVDSLRRRFENGSRLGLLIRSEHAERLYTTEFVASIFTAESGGLFDVRTAILGHVQQGGAPSPFDRIEATRLASAGVEHLIDRALAGDPTATMAGLRRGEVVFTPLAELPSLVQPGVQRVRERPWWMALRPVLDLLAHGEPNPGPRKSDVPTADRSAEPVWTPWQ
jgi:6-phosphofructokinase 1